MLQVPLKRVNNNITGSTYIATKLVFLCIGKVVAGVGAGEAGVGVGEAGVGAGKTGEGVGKAGVRA